MIKHIPEEHIDLAADAVITTRDFCGDEREAAHDCLADLGHGRADRDRVMPVVFARAKGEWNRFQKMAGVDARHRTI